MKEKLSWKDEPTKSGYYWRFVLNQNHPMLVEYCEEEDFYELFGWEEKFPAEPYRNSPGRKAKWFGPIDPPVGYWNEVTSYQEETDL